LLQDSELCQMSTSPLLAFPELVGDPQILWQDGERDFRRVWRGRLDGGRDAVIIVFSAAEEQTPEINERFAHEYALKDHLESAWALRPLELLHERGQSLLMVESPMGEPLVHHIGAPMELGAFLKVALSISASLSQ